MKIINKKFQGRNAPQYPTVFRGVCHKCDVIVEGRIGQDDLKFIEHRSVGFPIATGKCSAGCCVKDKPQLYLTPYRGQA